jgi:hypothetical protein
MEIENNNPGWSNLKSGSGKGTLVPLLIQQLKSEDQDVQFNAYESLTNELVHQGHVYEVAAFALPLLRDLFRTSNHELKQRIVVLIAEIGTGILPIHAVLNDGSDWRKILEKTGRSLDDELANEEIRLEQIKREVMKCLPDVAGFISDCDPMVRRVVADVISVYPESRNFALPVLVSALEKETDRYVRDELEKYIDRLGP